MADLGAFEEKKNPDGAVSYGFEGLDAACEAQIPPEVPAGYTEHCRVAPLRDGDEGRDHVRRRTRPATTSCPGPPKGKVKALAVLPSVPVVVTAEIAAGAGVPARAVGSSLPLRAGAHGRRGGPDGKLYVCRP